MDCMSRAAWPAATVIAELRVICTARKNQAGRACHTLEHERILVFQLPHCHNWLIGLTCVCKKSETAWAVSNTSKVETFEKPAVAPNPRELASNNRGADHPLGDPGTCTATNGYG